jgi:acetyl-CoA synthetase
VAMDLELRQLGIKKAAVKNLEKQIRKLKSPEKIWNFLVTKVFKNSQPFAIQKLIYEEVFARWDGPPPAWTPSATTAAKSNIAAALKDKKLKTYDDLYEWSITEREEFWEYVVKKLKIKEQKKHKKIFSGTAQHPKWLEGSKLNIADSCFSCPAKDTAIIFQAEGGKISKMSYGALKKLSCQVANGLKDYGFVPGDRIGIAMPMTAESVAIYLGIVMAGCAVVSIADSFAPDEIATRLRIANAKGIFTQDFIIRGGKRLPMFDKVVSSGAEKVIVLPCESKKDVVITRRDHTLAWKDFLSKKTVFKSVGGDPNAVTNVLFSSGTTGDPKAIPWNHSTPIKCAADGFFHQDIHKGDVVAWPTNLGWMMGPWLIYATLINRGTMALYYGAPTGKDFGRFVEKAKVNVLGLVPSIVKAWRNSECMKGLNWKNLKLFSSTGECSNVDDYLFVMSLANFKPVIEYCGGTEIGGGYVTGTVVQPASPATFTTPALGLELAVLNENQEPADSGELYIIPPSIGLSTELLNKDHDEVYYSGAPKGMRRHGDEVEKLPNGYWRAHGRADDTMNLGGIKVSSVEIERTLSHVDDVSETAAVAVNPPGGGPSLLVIFAVLKNKSADNLKEKMQNMIREKLNPLFKIHDVKIVDSLPRTASNKIMRRVLRQKI